MMMTSDRNVLLDLLIATAVCFAPSAFGADNEVTHPSFVEDGVLNVDAAVAHFEDLYRSSSSVAEMEMTVVRPRRTHTMGMRAWTEGTDKSLVEILSPARDRGSATLKVDNNLWNYRPRIERTVRVPPSMMLTSWMGSDFTNDDLVREASMVDDYDYEVVGPSEEPAGWLVRFTAKPDMVGLWNSIELVLCEDGALPIKATYYDRRDRLARTIHWDEVQVFDGRKLPARMTLIPEDEEGHKTVLVYKDLEFEVDLPRDLFSLSRLERGQ